MAGFSFPRGFLSHFNQGYRKKFGEHFGFCAKTASEISLSACFFAPGICVSDLNTLSMRALNFPWARRRARGTVKVPRSPVVIRDLNGESAGI